MAQFTSLYHAGEVLAYLIRSRLGLGDEQVVVGPPRDDILNPKKHLRVTLLWTNEQVTHRNDVHERNPDGSRTRPPLSLSALYLITAYGNTSLQASAEAHEALGDAMRALHDEPSLSLPLEGLAGRGKGKLGISQVPLTPELVEKLFGPLQIKHRTFALYELGPVQLESLKAMLATRPVVLPGGIRLSGPAVREDPVVQRVVPPVQGRGGHIRLDGHFPAPLTRVRVGSTSIEQAGIQVIDSGRSVSVVLPAAVSEGTFEVSVTAGESSSEPLQMAVVPATVSTLDAPTKVAHQKGMNLVLTGRSLTGVVEVIAWPDAGVQSPNDVVKLAAAAQATQVTVAASALQALSKREYRFAARIGANQYTPYIVLEVVP